MFSAYAETRCPVLAQRNARRARNLVAGPGVQSDDVKQRIPRDWLSEGLDDDGSLF